jgi:hypothetical protein
LTMNHSKRINESIDYNEVDITSIDQFQIDEKMQKRYEMPTFSS